MQCLLATVGAISRCGYSVITIMLRPIPMDDLVTLQRSADQYWQSPLRAEG